MLRLFFVSAIVFFISGFKSNSKHYHIVYVDTVPEKSIDTSKRNIKPDTLKDKHIIFTKAEVPPSIDKKVWTKHRQGYLVSYIEHAAKQNVPAGTYTVEVKFLVETDGSIKDVRAVNDVGYGFLRRLL
jgi:hypothetical protein